MLNIIINSKNAITLDQSISNCQILFIFVTLHLRNDWFLPQFGIHEIIAPGKFQLSTTSRLNLQGQSKAEHKNFSSIRQPIPGTVKAPHWRFQLNTTTKSNFQGPSKQHKKILLNTTTMSNFQGQPKAAHRKLLKISQINTTFSDNKKQHIKDFSSISYSRNNQKQFIADSSSIPKPCPTFRDTQKQHIADFS